MKIYYTQGRAVQRQQNNERPVRYRRYAGTRASVATDNTDGYNAVVVAFAVTKIFAVAVAVLCELCGKKLLPLPVAPFLCRTPANRGEVFFLQFLEIVLCYRLVAVAGS